MGHDRNAVVHDFAGLAGPYAFTPDETDLIDMFGPAENYPRMQATSFIDGRQPPMLLLWGADDKAVGQMNMDRLVSAIRARGGVVETKIYVGVDHMWLVGALSWLGHTRRRSLMTCCAFSSRRNKNPARLESGVFLTAFKRNLRNGQ